MNTILSLYKNDKEKLDLSLGALSAKTTEIIKLLAKILKIKDYWWDWSYYEYPGCAKLPSVSSETIGVYISTSFDDGVNFYSEEIPLVFYDMTDEQITKFVNKNIEETKKKEELRKLKAKQYQEKKSESKKEILKKLTKAELKILGIKSK